MLQYFRQTKEYEHNKTMVNVSDKKVNGYQPLFPGYQRKLTFNLQSQASPRHLPVL